MTKLQECLEILRSPGGPDLSVTELAVRVGCSKGQVKRARLVWKAEQLAGQTHDDAPDESARLLRDILAADEAEDLIREALGDLKKEATELKAQLKERAEDAKARRLAARESYPLWEGGGAGGPRLAGVDRIEHATAAVG
jgi:hypothetical protein